MVIKMLDLKRIRETPRLARRQASGGHTSRSFTDITSLWSVHWINRSGLGRRTVTESDRSACVPIVVSNDRSMDADCHES